MSKKILVTGGTGFIGSNLCERLVSEGNEVTCLDNFYSSQRENVAGLISNTNFKLVDHDICDPFNNEESYDEIYNLACPASPVWYQKDPMRTIRTCIDGSINVLEVARRCGSRVLQASTSEVYGDPLLHPQNEMYRGNVNMLGPRACYDEGKRMAETIFMEYFRSFGVRVRIARIFNTYGPGMAPDDGRVVSNFITQALADQPLTVYGGGSQTRSFQFISDLVEGLVRLMDSEFEQPVNLGNPVEFTVRELADMVILMLGSSGGIKVMPLPIDDPLQRRPDISLAREKLGWTPQVALHEGLLKTIPYFRERARAIRRDVTARA